MNQENPLLENKTADGVNLVDLCPPIYALSADQIPKVLELNEFSITKRCHLGNKSHFIDWYCAGHHRSSVFQSKAKAYEKVADVATQIANLKTKEALTIALQEGGKP